MNTLASRNKTRKRADPCRGNENQGAGGTYESGLPGGEREFGKGCGHGAANTRTCRVQQPHRTGDERGIGFKNRDTVSGIVSGRDSKLAGDNCRLSFVDKERDEEMVAVESATEMKTTEDEVGGSEM